MEIPKNFYKKCSNYLFVIELLMINVYLNHGFLIIIKITFFSSNNMFNALVASDPSL